MLFLSSSLTPCCLVCFRELVGWCGGHGCVWLSSSSSACWPSSCPTWQPCRCARFAAWTLTGCVPRTSTTCRRRWSRSARPARTTGATCPASPSAAGVATESLTSAGKQSLAGNDDDDVRLMTSLRLWWRGEVRPDVGGVVVGNNGRSACQG